jgi:hypothetical protein
MANSGLGDFGWRSAGERFGNLLVVAVEVVVVVEVVVLDVSFPRSRMAVRGASY